MKESRKRKCLNMEVMRRPQFFKYVFFILLLTGLEMIAQNNTGRTMNFPKERKIISEMPQPSQVWVFLMAGQSNMAGRGNVSPKDTVPVDNLIYIDSLNHWVQAKEPLHYYQPKLTGLDCGMSFGKSLKDSLPDNVVIALVPCAVGGSSIEQWLYDNEFNGVKLKSNFEAKLRLAKEIGEIRGILWHQGEANAYTDKMKGYKKKLERLFADFRKMAGNNKLPIIVGELGSYPASDSIRANCHIINQYLADMEKKDKYISLVHTEDLTLKDDNIHFDADSQRILGQRFAKTFLTNYKFAR